MQLDQQALDVLFESLRKELPPVFARSEAPKLLGGIIAYGTLANCDSAKKGPEGSFRTGRKVCYMRDPFLIWLGQRLSRP